MLIGGIEEEVGVETEMGTFVEEEGCLFFCADGFGDGGGRGSLSKATAADLREYFLFFFFLAEWDSGEEGRGGREKCYVMPTREPKKGEQDSVEHSGLPPQQE